jgi:protochlorophyllide reductase
MNLSSRWTEADMPALDGKTVVVTGGNAGLGLAAAKAFARHGARVVIACRNEGKASVAATEIRTEAPGSDIAATALDLASLESVAACARRLQDTEPRLDVLVNNAGLMAIDQATTADGFEMQFGVNHLGHFALTAQLAPLILATPGSRVVSVSSMGHRAGRLRLDDLFFEQRGYDRWRPYFQSKLANILFANELQRRLALAGSSTISLSAHPGGSNTDLGFEGRGILNKLAPLNAHLMQPAWLGALPIVRAAVDPGAQGGQFYGPRWIMRGYPRVETPTRRARRAEDGQRLWERSEQLTGVSFNASPVVPG